MSFVKKIADYFRAGGGESSKPVDRFNILSPIMASNEYVESTLKFVKLSMADPQIRTVLKRKDLTINSYPEKGKSAYQHFTKALSPHDQSMERQVPFSTILTALEAILGNLEIIEDNFQSIFGDSIKDAALTRSSSVIVVGYIETANAFCTWTNQLINHMTADNHTSIPPFDSKSLLTNAEQAGYFVTNNLGKWAPRYKGILSLVTDMKKKGTDVVISTGDTWIDSFVHDNQFDGTEQHLISAAFGNPILMYMSRRIVREQEAIADLESKKDWLISKIALAEARSHGLMEGSAEHKKLLHAIDFYANKMSKIQQQLERMRA